MPDRSPAGNDGVLVNGPALDDVTTYLQHRQYETIRAHPDLFDFDGNGTGGEVSDALALLREIIERR